MLLKAVEESKGGKITYRADKAGNVQAIIGKVSFETEKLVENFKAFNDAIQKLNQLQRKVLTSQTFQSLLHKVLVSKLILTHCKSSKGPIFG